MQKNSTCTSYNLTIPIVSNKHHLQPFIQRHFIVPIYQWTLKHRLLYPHVRFWIGLLFIVFFLWFLFALPSPLFNKPYSTIIDDKDGNFLSAKIADDYQWRFPVSDSINLRRYTEGITFFIGYKYTFDKMLITNLKHIFFCAITRNRNLYRLVYTHTIIVCQLFAVCCRNVRHFFNV